MNRFQDSFDHYTDLGQKYDAYQEAVIAALIGRYGTQGCDLSSVGSPFIQKQFDLQAGWVIGFAYYRNATSFGSPLVVVSSGSLVDGYQAILSVNQNNTLSLTSGSTVVTTTKTVSASTWYYLELKTTLGTGASAASFEIHGNGNLWASGTGSTSGSSADTIIVRGAGGPYLDDLYINDTSGSVNNDFWGNVRIECVYPTADGTYSQWTPSTGSAQWSLLDNVPYDNTAYISTGSIGVRSTFTLGTPVMGTGTIKAVQTSYLSNRNDGLAHQSAAVIRNSGTDYTSAANTITADIDYHSNVWNTHPNGTAWSEANFNASEFGVESVT